MRVVVSTKTLSSDLLLLMYKSLSFLHKMTYILFSHKSPIFPVECLLGLLGYSFDVRFAGRTFWAQHLLL